MAPTLHCIRHAQGYHNLSITNHQIHDPLLTAYGREQCLDLGKTFPYTSSIDLIVASPLKRTIYTALYTFDALLKEKGMTILALPELQETSDLPCDTGSFREELEREFAGMPVDLSFVGEGWNRKRMKWAPTATAITKRAAEARVWLSGRPEKEIVAVSHGGFLHYFTDDWTGAERYNGTGWANCEFRSYTFQMASSDDPRLIETQESRARRHGDDKPLDHNEATQLTRVSTIERERQEREAGTSAAEMQEIQVQV